MLQNDSPLSNKQITDNQSSKRISVEINDSEDGRLFLVHETNKKR